MFVVCAGCGQELGEKEPFEDTRISHGCCPECKEELLEEINITGGIKDGNRNKNGSD